MFFFNFQINNLFNWVFSKNKIIIILCVSLNNGIFYINSIHIHCTVLY